MLCTNSNGASDYPDGHPKAGVHLQDDWLNDTSVTSASDVTTDADFYYDCLASRVIDATKSSWLIAGVTREQMDLKKLVKKHWRKFIESISPFRKKVTIKNFEPLFCYHLNKLWAETPGRGGNIRCGPGARGRWRNYILRGAHIFFKLKYRFGPKTHNELTPQWAVNILKISRSKPLYQSDDAKLWCGEITLMDGYDKAFPGDSFDKLTCWGELNDIQRSWMIDKFAYETLARMVELIKSSPNASAARQQGLYWSQFSSVIYHDIVSYGSLHIPGILVHNDFQKNDRAATSSALNNRMVFHVSDRIAEKWKSCNRKYCTNRKFLSILIGYEIKSTDTTLRLPNKSLPVFPDYSAPMIQRHHWTNVNKKDVQTARLKLYCGIIPNTPSCPALSKMSGHVWRGARVLELIAMGVPHFICARMGRWLSIRSMLEYVSSDIYGIINFSLLRPSLARDRESYGKLAWYYANHRLFLGVDDFIKDTKKKLGLKLLV